MPHFNTKNIDLLNIVLLSRKASFYNKYDFKKSIVLFLVYKSNCLPELKKL